MLILTSDTSFSLQILYTNLVFMKLSYKKKWVGLKKERTVRERDREFGFQEDVLNLGKGSSPDSFLLIHQISGFVSLKFDPTTTNRDPL